MIQKTFNASTPTHEQISNDTQPRFVLPSPSELAEAQRRVAYRFGTSHGHRFDDEP